MDTAQAITQKRAQCWGQDLASTQPIRGGKKLKHVFISWSIASALRFLSISPSSRTPSHLPRVQQLEGWQLHRQDPIPVVRWLPG